MCDFSGTVWEVAETYCLIVPKPVVALDEDYNAFTLHFLSSVSVQDRSWAVCYWFLPDSNVLVVLWSQTPVPIMNSEF